MRKNYLIKFILSGIITLVFGINTSFSQEYQNQDSLERAQKDTYVIKSKQRSGMDFGFFMGPSWSIPVGNSPQLIPNAQYQTIRDRARTSFFIGLRFNFFLSNKTSVEFNTIFNSLGKRTDFSGYYHELGYSEEKESYVDALNYFIFPLTLNYYLNDNIYVKGGIYGATLAGAHRRDGGIYGDYYDVKDLYRGGDFGVTAGIGAAYKVMYIEWRYSRGLIDITFDEDNYYNQNVQLVLGLKFGG